MDPIKRKVLVCHGKYGDYYYAGDNSEELAQSALAVLTERWHEGHWYMPPDTEQRKKDMAMASVTDEAINAQPESVQRSMRDTREWSRGNVSRDAHDARWYEQARRAVEEQDSLLALRLLEMRNDHEYECVTVEPLREAHEA